MEPNEQNLFSNRSLYESLLKNLKDYKNRDWDKTGYEQGIRRHSYHAYNEGIELISKQLNMLFLEVTDKLDELILEADIDLYQAGPDGEARHIAELKKKFWDDKLEFCKKMAAKDHAADTSSEFHAIILSYRSGFNQGHRLYLKSSGQATE